MRQGKAAERLTIFAEENFVSKIFSRQGEGFEWGIDFNLSSLGATRHSPRRGKQECSVFAPIYLPRLPDGNSARIPDGRLYFIFVAGIINV